MTKINYLPYLLVATTVCSVAAIAPPGAHAKWVWLSLLGVAGFAGIYRPRERQLAYAPTRR